MHSQVLFPAQNYVLLAADGTATTLPGGERFWSLPPAQIERHGHGWLVAEFEFSADWPNWEIHPEADELVYVLTGSARLLLELPNGVQAISLHAPGLIVVPRGVWHTAKVSEPSRFLHVTMATGTQHRKA